MDLFKSSREKHLANLQEEAIYARVAKEIDENNVSQGILAKAIAECKGDQKLARARYIELRVQLIKSELNAVREIEDNYLREQRKIALQESQDKKKITQNAQDKAAREKTKIGILGDVLIVGFISALCFSAAFHSLFFSDSWLRLLFGLPLGLIGGLVFGAMTFGYYMEYKNKK